MPRALARFEPITAFAADSKENIDRRRRETSGIRDRPGGKGRGVSSGTARQVGFFFDEEGFRRNRDE